jgi:hypothetical protein
MGANVEKQRLEEYRRQQANWKLWGPYLSERAWGTVREDYSPTGDAWNYFTHEPARSRAYRWNEDGLLGFSDRNQYLCFALALWNGQDSILKERLYGLTGTEGNHGEDVKEYYYYLDSTPTHSYVKMLYKYPQGRFPYELLREESAKRGVHDAEYELLDTGIFDDNRYFDVFIEYAKNGIDDLCIRCTVYNRGLVSAPLHILPTLWFRNTWSWGYRSGPMGDVIGKPRMQGIEQNDHGCVIRTDHSAVGSYWWHAQGCPEWLFTDNETNHQLLFNSTNTSKYVKDAFHRYLVEGELAAINPLHVGTKAALHYQASIPGNGGSLTLRWRLCRNSHPPALLSEFDAVIEQRRQECDAFYQDLQPSDLKADIVDVQRQAFAGMLCSKQLYYYDVEQWFKGDPIYPPPADQRRTIRNTDWGHIVNFDIISMPDKWEYPWYASWDLAFHSLPLALVDPDFAKRQLVLMTREWYMHPNGQLPAYEWNFNDVNPPVHAWAAYRIYQIDAKYSGSYDRAFLLGIFNKLLLNFTWWVNRKDAKGRNLFQGGFLGLDNISIFNRSSLPMGGYLDQSDGTSWMGFYCLVMMKIALELAKQAPVFQDTATKFFEHFLRIASAMQNCKNPLGSLWNEEDGFFYDTLYLSGKQPFPIKIRSLIGLMPLLAVETLEADLLREMPIFNRRIDWFMSKRPDISGCHMMSMYQVGEGEKRLFSIVPGERLRLILRYMFDETEFLSPYGIRSLSKRYEEQPYHLDIAGKNYHLSYQPAEAASALFGGNSNWRGPVWFPINYLLIESLQKYHYYYGDDFKVEFPTGSGCQLNLSEIAQELSRRLVSLFTVDKNGKRPIYGACETMQQDPYWKDMILFYEYFHGDTGVGLGASHQTGWTGLVAKLIQQGKPFRT